MWEVNWKKLIPDENGYPTETPFDQGGFTTHWDAQDFADALEREDPDVYDLEIIDL